MALRGGELPRTLDLKGEDSIRGGLFELLAFSWVRLSELISTALFKGLGPVDLDLWFVVFGD